MKPELEKALNAALEGPEIQRLKVYGYHWNIKPAEVLSREGSCVVIEGQIDRSQIFLNDDHLFYKFVWEDHTLKEQSLRIEERGLGQIAGIIAETIDKFIGLPIPPDEIEEIGNKLEDMGNGEWEYAIQKLALRIGLEAYKRMYSITAYTKPGFKGTSQTFTPGVYEADDFWAVGNDRITSIRVPSHMEVLVCKSRPGVGKPGECKTYAEDMTELHKEVMGVSYLNVEDLDNPSRTLIVDGTKANLTQYVIEIVKGSGWLHKNARQGSIRSSDNISDDWTRAEGVVGGSKDAYTFTGTLKEVKLTGDKKNVVVKLDDKRLSAMV